MPFTTSPAEFLRELRAFERRCEQANETDVAELWEYMGEAVRHLEAYEEAMETPVRVSILGGACYDVSVPSGFTYEVDDRDNA